MMRIRCCAFVLMLQLVLPKFSAIAAEQNWNVQPKVCIVEKLGASCEMVLAIKLEQLPKGTYCYYQDDAILLCWPHDNPIDELKVRFSKATKLSLRNQQNQSIFEHELDIKARDLPRKTRRVRQPWSLF